MGTFLYVRPDEMFSYGASVSASGVDLDYDQSWLADTRVGRPARMTSGNLSATLSGSGDVGLVALINHNVGVDATVSGDVAGTLTAGELQPNGIRLNPFLQVDNTSAASITVDVSGNADDVVVGEIVAGRVRELFPGPPPKDQDRSDNDYALDETSEFGSVARYDRGLVRRSFSFTQIYFQAQFIELQALQLSQKGGSLPIIIVPDTAINDAWAVYLAPLKYRKIAVATYSITLSFLEYPRVRW